MSTPSISSSGNARPQSTTMISFSYSNTVKFFPISFKPPSGITFNLDFAKILSVFFSLFTGAFFSSFTFSISILSFLDFLNFSFVSSFNLFVVFSFFTPTLEVVLLALVGLVELALLLLFSSIIKSLLYYIIFNLQFLNITIKTRSFMFFSFRYNLQIKIFHVIRLKYYTIF